MRLLIFLAVVLVALAAAAYRWPSFRRRLIAVRHLPITVLSYFRWSRLAAHSGLGRWKLSERTGRRHPKDTPRTTRWHPTTTGYTFRVRLRLGDAFVDLANRVPELAIGLRGTVRLRSVPGKPWRVDVCVQRLDPFSKPVAPPVALSATRLSVGVTEVGTPFVLDARVSPHYLCSGSTGSGKSSGISAIFAALAPTDAVLCAVDLKHGVSSEPIRLRATRICETRQDASDLFNDLLELGKARAQVIKAAGVESVYDLDEPMREVWVAVDEVSELAVGSTTDEKAAAAAAMSSLLRCCQLLRSFGVHIVVGAQRFGSSQGAKVTDVRAQLSGRIAYRMSDIESANMAVGDVSPMAALAALEIPAGLPGVAVSNTGPDRFELVRMAHVPHRRLAEIATHHADKRVTWSQLVAETRPLAAVPNPPISADLHSSGPQDETQAFRSGEPAA